MSRTASTARRLGRIIPAAGLSALVLAAALRRVLHSLNATCRTMN